MTEEELLDIYDENMDHIGTATRTKAHREGYWHQTLHCWIIREGSDGYYVLFQKRSKNKKIHPNLFDVTAAGHILAGETPKDGVREVEEELGFPANFESLKSLGIRFNVSLSDSLKNREFCNTYLLEKNVPIEEYELQQKEVSALVQMRIEDGLKLFNGEIKSSPVSGFRIDDEGIRIDVDKKVTEENFVPSIDNYYLKIFIMADRYFNDEGPLVI